MTKLADVRVSDHALLRFLEKAGGLDVETLRRAMSASIERATAMADKLGADEYAIVVDGFRYIVRCGTVTTVQEDQRR
ncbi:MAG: hypothetical protein ACOY6K_22385 [Pseudomonadota bacterium]